MDKKALKQKTARYLPLYKIHQDRLGRFLRSPWHTGSFYIMNALAYIRPYQVSKRMPWGAAMSFYLPEGNQIYYYDFWEINISNLFINILEPGDIFVDVGAHVGYYSSLAATLVGENGKVIAFEPTPRTFLNTKKNLSFFTNTLAFNKALSDVKGSVAFVDYGPKYSAFNSLTARTEVDFNKINAEATTITVECDVLDSVLASDLVPTVIKIDAEGAESTILKGGQKMIASSRPLITFEVGGDTVWNHSTTESFLFLEKVGYLFFTATVEGYLTPHKKQTLYTYDNIIAVHPSRLEKYHHLIKE